MTPKLPTKKNHDGSPEEWTAERHARLRGRLGTNLARMARELDASESPPSRTAIALAMAVLVVVAFAAGALHRLPDRLSAAVLLGPGGPNALPLSAFTPGAVHAATAAELCAARRPLDRIVSPRVRLAVLRDYQMERVAPQEYELDYLITPELGGAPTRQNLWPERYGSHLWNARVKDQLEDLLPRLVCDGRLDLATAQRDIAVDWIAAYKKYFHTSQPLPPLTAFADDDERVIEEPPRPLVALVQLAWRE